MGHKNISSSQNPSTIKPVTINLQTRPFAPLEVSNMESSSQEQAEETSKKQGFSENLLEKLINTPTPESATPVQRKPENRLKALQKLAIQTKLNIGEPNDKYEKEADETAAKVVQQINTPLPNQPIQRQESMEEEDELQMKSDIPLLQRQESMEEEDELQMKSLLQRSEGVGGGVASTDLESSIQRARGSGQSLDSSLSEKLGHSMGADFSGVKIHTDSQSDQLNKSIQAKAFTTGQDVFFRQGAYDPSSRGGQELIAHELTHVVQQNKGVVQRHKDDRQFKVNSDPQLKTKLQREEEDEPAIPMKPRSQPHNVEDILNEFTPTKENIEEEIVQLKPQTEQHSAGDVPLRNSGSISQQSSQDQLPISSSSSVRNIIQRKNDATPQNFRDRSISGNDTKALINHQFQWESSTGNLGDLDDVKTREHLYFNHNPVTNFPTYQSLGPSIGYIVESPIVYTNRPKTMQSGQAEDNHDPGDGLYYFKGDSINIDPDATWPLEIIQNYEYQRPGEDWQLLNIRPYTIKYEYDRGRNKIKTTKTGGDGNVNCSALGTIQGAPSNQKDIEPGQLNARQVAASTGALSYNGRYQALIGNRTDRGEGGHSIVQNGTDRIAVGKKQKKQQVDVIFEVSNPDLAKGWDQQMFDAFSPSETVAGSDITTAKGYLTTMLEALGEAGSQLPTPIRLLVTNGSIMQQAMMPITPFGAEYRMILRPKALHTAPDPNNLTGKSISGKAYAEKTMTPHYFKKKGWAKDNIMHEMGHMLHAFENESAYRAAAAAGQNGVIQELLHKGYANQWSYALQNPAEVVAETFLSYMTGKTVPSSLAATYVAYGGPMNSKIESGLTTSLGGGWRGLGLTVGTVIPYIQNHP